MKRVFEVETAHTSYGDNYSRYTVMATSALSAIKKVKNRLVGGEFVLEVKHIASVD